MELKQNPLALKSGEAIKQNSIDKKNTTKNVYIVFNEERHGRHIVGVYSTKKKAEDKTAELKKLPISSTFTSYSYEEYVVE